MVVFWAQMGTDLLLFSQDLLGTLFYKEFPVLSKFYDPFLDF